MSTWTDEYIEPDQCNPLGIDLGLLVTETVQASAYRSAVSLTATLNDLPVTAVHVWYCENHRW